MSELLANISSDIRTDGRLDNPTLGSQLMNNAAYIDCDQIISNMQEKYSGLGATVSVTGNELKNYIEQFKSNCGFEQTSHIVYPEIGRWGSNILADGFVEAKSCDPDRVSVNTRPIVYSIRAELPAGNSSLKIVIRNKNTEPAMIYPNGHITPALSWGGYLSGTDENWNISNFDNTVMSRTFTVRESGIPADVGIIVEDDFIIEYYENGATEPTKVNEITVPDGYRVKQ